MTDHHPSIHVGMHNIQAEEDHYHIQIFNHDDAFGAVTKPERALIF